MVLLPTRVCTSEEHSPADNSQLRFGRRLWPSSRKGQGTSCYPAYIDGTRDKSDWDL
jgi:hypothetical protein